LARLYLFVKHFDRITVSTVSQINLKETILASFGFDSFQVTF
jgi:hypothetical protein